MSAEKKLHAHRPIVVYCPDCGDIFELGDSREKSGYCPTCKRWYFEDEVRNRCVL